MRDTARYFDACNGFDSRDPLSLPVRRWMGGGIWASYDLDRDVGGHRGRSRDRPGPRRGGRAWWRRRRSVWRRRRVTHRLGDAHFAAPAWGLGDGQPAVDRRRPRRRYPDSVRELSREIAAGLESARERYDLERAASIERYRRQLNGAMAALFDEADFVFCSTHPDVAFKAEGPPPSTLPGA